jgi:hypothetical protein
MAASSALARYLQPVSIRPKEPANQTHTRQARVPAVAAAEPRVVKRIGRPRTGSLEPSGQWSDGSPRFRGRMALSLPGCTTMRVLDAATDSRRPG